MVTTDTAYQLSVFLYENKIRKADLKGLVRHKTNPAVYGAFFDTDKGLLYVQHKWEKCPGNEVPRVYAKEVSKFKLVDEGIFAAFDYITAAEHSECWGNALEKI